METKGTGAALAGGPPWPEGSLLIDFPGNRAAERGVLWALASPNAAENTSRGWPSAVSGAPRRSTQTWRPGLLPALLPGESGHRWCGPLRAAFCVSLVGPMLAITPAWAQSAIFY